MIRLFLLTYAFLAIFSLTTFAATITVCSSGCDFTTIQGALDSLPSPGDTISVTGQGTYSENLTLKNSGTSGNIITLKNDSGNTVTVTSSTSPVLRIRGNDYWTVDGFDFIYTGSGTSPSVILNDVSRESDYVTIKNCIATRSGGSGGQVMGFNSSDNLTIDNCTFNILSGSGGIDGVILIYTSNLEFINNTIVGIDSTIHDDGIVVTGKNINIENNILSGGNTIVAHPDAIVIQGDGDRNGNNTENVKIHGNEIRDYSQGIYVDALWADLIPPILIYNNLIIETAALTNYNMNAIVISGENVAQPSNHFASPAEIYNNTIDVGQIAIYFNSRNTGGGAKVIKNNIIMNATIIGSAIYIVSGENDLTIDYNAYLGGDSRPIKRLSTYYSTDSFCVSGFGECNAQNLAATILDSNYKPDDLTDPIINVGTNLSSIFTTDKANLSRPQGTNWDIGAYEFDVNAPSAPANFRVQ